jgi:hypothetical protein
MTLDQLSNALRGMPSSGAAQAVSRHHLDRVVVLVGILARFGAAARYREKSASPLGLWQTQGGGVIEISRCVATSCFGGG